VEKPDLRRRWLLTSTAIGVAGCLALSQLVYANDECGTIVGNSVTCTSAGNNYTSGISYDPTDDLTMVVQDGVTITPSSGNEGIDITFPSGNLFDLDLRLYDSDAATDITTSGSGAEGILISRAHDVTLVNQADITSGNDDGMEIHASGAVTIDNSGTITSSGRGIYTSFGSLNLTNSGAITTTTSSSNGIFVRYAEGDTTITLSETGTVDTLGTKADGIGIRGFPGVEEKVYLLVAGAITTRGDAANGISLNGIDGHSIIVQSDTGSIITYGDGAHGIEISASNAATINNSGVIATFGNNSHGIYTIGIAGAVDITASGFMEIPSEM